MISKPNTMEQELGLANRAELEMSGKTMLQVLHSLFSSGDVVGFKNTKDYPLGWKNADKEHLIRRREGTAMIVEEAPLQKMVIEPGKSVRMYGWQAFTAIQRMYNYICQKDGLTQEIGSTIRMYAFLKEHYLGKLDFTTMKFDRSALMDELQEENEIELEEISEDELEEEVAPEAPETAPEAKEVPKTNNYTATKTAKGVQYRLNGRLVSKYDIPQDILSTLEVK
jgi:hypothetical protein